MSLAIRAWFLGLDWFANPESPSRSYLTKTAKIKTCHCTPIKGEGSVDCDPCVASASRLFVDFWIPAFAGMTGLENGREGRNRG